MELEDSSQLLPSISLRLIPIPNFYSQLSRDGIPLQKIALMHGDRTLATTINQRCIFWRTGSQCRFCAIEISLNAGSTIERKTADQIIDVIEQARLENPSFASHLTLTIGSQASEFDTIQSYIPLVKKIKQRFPTLPIHVQCEPVKDLDLLVVLHAPLS